MNTTDNKPKSDAGDIGGAETGVDKVAEDKGLLAVILAFMTGLGIALAVGWVVYPALLYSEQEQPVQFNHELHMAEAPDGCESCHFFREDGTFSGVPGLAQCRDCHESAIGESEEELTFVEEYMEKDREVPWLIYSRQPDCVFFSHAAHVLKAGMTCEECHGSVGESTSLKTYQENRITGYSRDIWGEDLTGIFRENPWDSMKMDDCARCHEKETGSKGACFQCHK
jgi:hypothetical protein